MQLTLLDAVLHLAAGAVQLLVEGKRIIPTINAERFIEFLGRLIEDASSKVFLIVENLRVHHARIVKSWAEQHADRIELFYLPPYAPESNPDEYLNHDFKTALRLDPPSRDDAEFLIKARTIMERIAGLPERIRSYFQHPAAV